MTFEEVIQSARSRFVNNGRFSMLPHESINEVVSREKVPNAPGVYILFRSGDLGCPLYIGKAGTLKADGSWKNQGLGKRMTMKQEKVSRREFFRKMMAKKGHGGLTFFWFVTHNQSTRVIPAFAEMELLQAYYDRCGHLPELNKCV
jgi:hypothetical protein